MGSVWTLRFTIYQAPKVISVTRDSGGLSKKKLDINNTDKALR